MTALIGIEALTRLRDQELYGLQKLFFRALTCPKTDPVGLPAIRAMLTAIETELHRRSYHPAPAF